MSADTVKRTENLCTSTPKTCHIMPPVFAVVIRRRCRPERFRPRVISCHFGANRRPLNYHFSLMRTPSDSRSAPVRPRFPRYRRVTKQNCGTGGNGAGDKGLCSHSRSTELALDRFTLMARYVTITAIFAATPERSQGPFPPVCTDAFVALETLEQGRPLRGSSAEDTAAAEASARRS
jgi:hypothetical protein